MSARYINPRSKPFAHLDRLSAWQRGERPAPVTLEWDLSNRCPWGCVDCHFAYTHTKGPWVRDATRRLPMLHDKAGDLADTAGVLRVLVEAASAGVQGIVWTGGGEPSIHPDALTIWRQASSLQLEQGLYTLGATLTDDQIAHVARFAWVVVSLDHACPEDYRREKRSPPHGFRRACDAIVALSGQTCTVGVSFLLHERNFAQAADMVSLGRSLGASYVTLRPTIRTQPDDPAAPVGDRAWVYQAMPSLELLARQPDVEVDPARFLQWAEWRGHPYATCYGIRLNATITPDLRLWVCPNRREYGDGSCLGDLTQERFADVWARHPGQWTDFRACRAMCRLHPLNETLAAVYAPQAHAAFL